MTYSYCTWFQFSAVTIYAFLQCILTNLMRLDYSWGNPLFRMSNSISGVKTLNNSNVFIRHTTLWMKESRLCLIWINIDIECHTKMCKGTMTISAKVILKKVSKIELVWLSENCLVLAFVLFKQFRNLQHLFKKWI